MKVMWIYVWQCIGIYHNPGTRYLCPPGYLIHLYTVSDQCQGLDVEGWSQLSRKTCPTGKTSFTSNTCIVLVSTHFTLYTRFFFLQWQKTALLQTHGVEPWCFFHVKPTLQKLRKRVSAWYRLILSGLLGRASLIKSHVGWIHLQCSAWLRGRRGGVRGKNLKISLFLCAISMLVSQGLDMQQHFDIHYLFTMINCE